MDPTAALYALRALAADILRVSDSGTLPDGLAALILAERVQALDEWISRGGFLPHDWTRSEITV